MHIRTCPSVHAVDNLNKRLDSCMKEDSQLDLWSPRLRKMSTRSLVVGVECGRGEVVHHGTPVVKVTRTTEQEDNVKWIYRQ